LNIWVLRETTKECYLGGYEIPTKTLVYVRAWAVGRFLGSSIDLKGNDSELRPFGASRRICPNLLHIFVWEMPFVVNREDIDIDDVLVKKKEGSK
jgi:hypothetical protein